MNKRKVLNIIIFIIVLFNWSRMALGRNTLAFTSRGITSLKYYTVLSNLLEAFASLIWIFNKNEKIKYIAATSVVLTMLVVLCFLGPLFGYSVMFIGVNFWMHLIVPIMVLFEIIFISKAKYSFKDNLLACIPLLIYGLFYMANNLINGVGRWPYTNDWYGFFIWGYPIAFLLFFVLIIVVYLIAFTIRKIKDRQ